MTASKIIAGSYSAEYAVNNADTSRPSWNIGADLGHQDNECNLPDIGGLTGHVGTGDNKKAGVLMVQRGVIRNEFLLHQSLLEDWMPTVDDFQIT